MKEFKLEDINPVADINNKIWQAINILKQEVTADKLYVVLYIIASISEEIFPDIDLDKNGEPFLSLPHIDLDGIQDKRQKETIEALYSFEDIFSEDVQNIRNKTWAELHTLLRSINPTILRENLADIFEENLYRITKYQGRIGGTHLLPFEISRFLCSFANLRETATVYNPFAGFASFGCLFQENIIYIGQEINEKSCAIGELRLMAHKKNSDSFLFHHDSLKDWGLKSLVDDDNKIVFDKFDLIISNPPYGGKVPLEINGNFGMIETFEHFLIEKGLEKLKDDGRLIAVISLSFLFRSGNEQNLRKYLVENDLLEMVISLPGGLLMGTGISVSVLVINKNKQEKGIVRFIDAKNFVEASTTRDKKLKDYALNSFIKSNKESDFSTNISNETIKKYDYTLTVPRYFQKKYNGIALGELGSLIRGQRIIEGQKGKFIRVRELKDDVLDFQLNLSAIEDVDIPRHAQKISESCLLLASRWKTLKPTYFNFTGTSIFISPDTFAFRVDESKCDIVYLVNELHSAYVTEQLDSYRVGDVIPMIRKEDLLSIVISLPNLDDQSLESQKSIVKQRLLALAEEKKKELNLFNKIHGLEMEIVEQNTYLRHTLAGPSSNLKDSISNIKRIILDKVIPLHPELLDLKIDDKHLVSLGEYLNIIERDATKIVLAVTNQLKVDTGIETKKLSPIDIISFLEKYTIEYNDRVDLAYRIDFSFDKEVFIDENGERIKAYISANEELLVDLFDNLIDNAVKHAFVPELTKRIEIFIMKDGENENKDEIEVIFSNTGKPFPEDFTLSDFVRKGSKLGPNAGDGFGGWYINEIVKKLNGAFDIIDQTDTHGLTDTDWATSFAFTFPIIEIEENV